MFIYEGTSDLVSGGFLNCFSIVYTSYILIEILTNSFSKITIY